MLSIVYGFYEIDRFFERNSFLPDQINGFIRQLRTWYKGLISTIKWLFLWVSWEAINSFAITFSSFIRWRIERIKSWCWSNRNFIPSILNYESRSIGSLESLTPLNVFTFASPSTSDPHHSGCFFLLSCHNKLSQLDFQRFEHSPLPILLPFFFSVGFWKM